MSWFGDLVDHVKHAASTVANATVDGADDVYSGIEKGVVAVVDTTEKVINPVASAADSAWNTVKGAAGTAWDDANSLARDSLQFVQPRAMVSTTRTPLYASSPSPEINAVGDAIEQTGIQITSAFVGAADEVRKAIAAAAKSVGPGLVTSGKFESAAKCEATVAGSIAKALAAVSAAGEEVAPIARLRAYVKAADSAVEELSPAAEELGKILARDLHADSHIKTAVASAESLAAIVSRLVVTVIEARPILVHTAAGGAIAGGIIFGLTTLICEGKALRG